MVVLCLGAGPDVQYWYADTSQTTLELKINTGTYTVIKDTYAGYTEGEEGQKYHKFGYVEEVECEIRIAQSQITTIVADKLWYIEAINVPAELNLGTGSLLEVLIDEFGAWYKPVYMVNDTGTVTQFSIICDDDPDEAAIVKLKILR